MNRPPYFTNTGAGQRYASYRPKVHALLIDQMQAHVARKTFDRALDVACGTGDSTVPLRRLSDNVLGIDASEEMLAIARRRGLSAHHADYRDMARFGRFDLISTAMAFHWFEPKIAIRAYKNASNPGAVWFIYNFVFAGHSRSAAFNRWFQSIYLDRYPSPPRQSSENINPGDDPEIALLAKQTGELPIQFTPDSLVGYLSTHSNVEAALRGGRSLQTVCRELRAELAGMDLSGSFRYRYAYEILVYQGRQASAP